MANNDYRIQIETPENLVLEMDIAGVGGRCIAAIIDGILLLFISIFVFALLAISFGAGGSLFRVGAVVLFVQVAVFTLYHLLFELMMNGQTPGKRRLGMRVVQANGMPITASSVLIRNLTRLFDFLPILYGVGLISLFTTERTQRLGDMAAGTIVIYENPEVTLENLRIDYTINRMWSTVDEEIPVMLDIGNLSQQDRQLVVSYLRRRFSIAGREQLGSQVAHKIGVKVELPANIVYSFQDLGTAERFLEFVARAFDREEEERLENRQHHENVLVL